MQDKRSANHKMAGSSGLPKRRGATAPRPRAARAAPEERQESILKAALDVFAENGFAATRLEDIAHRAGVAKGTVYLYFPDKQALFEGVLQSLAAPLLEKLSMLAANEHATPGLAIELFLEFFQTEVLDTSREKVFRLMIAEGPRFPALAKFYYDNVVSKGLASVRKLMSHQNPSRPGHAEILARFPQLVFAPLLMTVVWRSLFSNFEPLDATAFLDAHKTILTGPEREA